MTPHRSSLSPQRSARGFTLVEVIIASVIGAGVIGVVWGMLRMSTQIQKRSEERLGPRDVATRVFAQIRRGLMDASELKVDLSLIAFRTAAGEGSIRLESETGTIQILLPGGSSPIRVGQGSIVELRSSFISRGLLQVTLVMNRPDSTGRLTALGDFEMSDDILIPAIVGTPVGSLWSPLGS